jgi:Helix-turn-helix domain
MDRPAYFGINGTPTGAGPGGPDNAPSADDRPTTSALLWASMFRPGEAPPAPNYAISFDAIRALPSKVLTDAEKLLMEAMQFRPSANGDARACTASNATLAKLVAKSSDRVERLISGLKAKGWLEARYENGGTQRFLFIRVPAEVVPIISAWAPPRRGIKARAEVNPSQIRGGSDGHPPQSHGGSERYPPQICGPIRVVS